MNMFKKTDFVFPPKWGTKCKKHGKLGYIYYIKVGVKSGVHGKTQYKKWGTSGKWGTKWGKFYLIKVGYMLNLYSKLRRIQSEKNEK